jgi:prepilin-type N-terminal cleavage/methylation domain-containing protein
MRARRGFTLLEVMLATGILVVALVVLVQTQWTAAEMTFLSDRILVATQLAQEKIAEVRMRVEREGFQTADIYEKGDFDDFGDEALDLQMKDLKDYHWEYLVAPVDLELAGDLTASAQQLATSLGAGAGGTSGASSQATANIPNLGGMLSPDMLTKALDPYVREVRVRVWWGDDSKEAEELKNEVVVTTHLVNPSGQVFAADPNAQPTQR